MSLCIAFERSMSWRWMTEGGSHPVPEGWMNPGQFCREIVIFLLGMVSEFSRDLFGKVGLGDQPDVWESKGHFDFESPGEWCSMIFVSFILVRESQLNTMRSLLANEILATSRFMRFCNTKFRTGKLYLFCFSTVRLIYMNETCELSSDQRVQN